MANAPVRLLFHLLASSLSAEIRTNSSFPAHSFKCEINMSRSDSTSSVDCWNSFVARQMCNALRSWCLTSCCRLILLMTLIKLSSRFEIMSDFMTSANWDRSNSKIWFICLRWFGVRLSFWIASKLSFLSHFFSDFSKWFVSFFVLFRK